MKTIVLELTDAEYDLISSILKFFAARIIDGDATTTCASRFSTY